MTTKLPTSGRAPNKAHLAALESLVEALTTPALPKGFGAPATASALLRWMHTRLVRVEGVDPRAGHVRSLMILAERLEEAVPAAQEALDAKREA